MCFPTDANVVVGRVRAVKERPELDDTVPAVLSDLTPSPSYLGQRSHCWGVPTDTPDN